MRLLSQMNNGQAWNLSAHSPTRGTRTHPALSRERARWKSVLLDQQPSLLTLRRRARGPYSLSLLPPSCLTFAAGISEVSRFSCMKFLGVPGAFDYAGPTRLALSPLSVLPSAHVNCIGLRVVYFRSSISHPAYSPVYASPCTSRCPTQNSGPKWIVTPSL